MLYRRKTPAPSGTVKDLAESYLLHSAKLQIHIDGKEVLGHIGNEFFILPEALDLDLLKETG